MPVKFTQQTKSDIGYKFLSIINTGRWRTCRTNATIDAQYRNCRQEILPGPAKIMRWYVPEGLRDRSGQLIHDDHLLADSLIGILDTLTWHVQTDTVQLKTPDPLKRESHD